MFMIFDPVYMINHLMINVLSVDIINATFERTICVDELLACCDPFNKWDVWIGWFPVNGWLLGHFFAYAVAGCFYAKDDWIRQFNVALGQVGWFWFEFWTYYHTYEWEQLTYYKKSNTTNELGDGVLLNTYKKLVHPCPDLAYYSTWIPIWEDFIYNTAGQVLGMYIWIKYYKNDAQTPREALEEKFEEAFVPMLEEVPAETDGIKVYAISDTAALLENKEDMPTRLVVQKGKPMAYVPGSPQPVAVSLQGSEVEINGNAAVSANGSPASTGSGIEMDGRHVNLEPSIDTV